MMLARPLIMTGLLGAAVAAPIAVTEGPKHWPGVMNSWADSANAPPAPAVRSFDPRQATLSGPRGPGTLVYESPAPIEGTGFVTLNQLFRTDVTKEWVYTHWARKTTGLADPELFGVRVPVVTGTSMTDLAGSLSYYFNSDGRVDRLRFHGRTADTTQIVAIAQQAFGMTPQRPTAPGEQLFQTLVGKNIQNQLRTSPAPILWATSPHESFTVDFEANRDGTERYVQTPKLNFDPPKVAESPKLKPPAVTSPAPAIEPPQQQVAQAGQDGAPGEASTSGGVKATEVNLNRARRPDFRWPN